MQKSGFNLRPLFCILVFEILIESVKTTKLAKASP